MIDGNPFAETVLDGSLLAALPVAALAGLVSFASPCVLPLVPGYLGYVTGLTGIDLQKQKRGRMLAGIGLFVLGFTLVFLLMSVVLAQLGALPWLRGQGWVMVVLGVLVIVMGLVFMGGIGALQRERKIERRPPPGLWGAPLLGITFGLGWAPCIGPTFAAVQALAYSGGSSVGKAALLTVVYCLWAIYGSSGTIVQYAFLFVLFITVFYPFFSEERRQQRQRAREASAISAGARRS